jgi:hypothetical protein
MNHLACLLLTILLTVYPVICLSAELYHWVDESGAHHITDNPPDNSTKFLSRIEYKEHTPEEIQRDEAEQKAKQIKSDKEADFQRKMSELDSAKEKERQYKQSLHDAAQLQATEDLRRMEGNLEFYRDQSRNPRPSQWLVNQYEYEQRVQEREIGESPQNDQP